MGDGTVNVDPDRPMRMKTGTFVSILIGGGLAVAAWQNRRMRVVLGTAFFSHFLRELVPGDDAWVLPA